MATLEQIAQVRLNIDDLNSDDFDDAIITSYIDGKNSVNYASYKLIDILIMRLRKEIVKDDTAGSESTEFQDLEERLEILQDQRNKYKNYYDSETGNTTGRIVDTIKPVIAGGMN